MNDPMFYHKLENAKSGKGVWKITIDDGFGHPHTYEIKASSSLSIHLVYRIIKHALGQWG